MSALEALVEGGRRQYGRLAARPASVNPLDKYTGISRALRRLRLKEWVGFTLIHPELYSSMIIQDANYLASSEIYAVDRLTGMLAQHARNAAGGRLRPPETLRDGDRAEIRKHGYLLRYDFGEQRYRISIDIAAGKTGPAFIGELQLEVGGASAPLSVSSRLPGGAMYTHKRIFPVSGALRVGERTYTFEPDRDLAIIDEHKSFFPYRTHWAWATFAWNAAGRPVGANAVSRPELPGEPEESCIWAPGTVEPLAEIRFYTPLSDSLGAWHIVSADERLDVMFTPEGRKAVKHQLGLASIDYFQLYGTYCGILRAESGTYELNDVHGVCESMKTRF